MTLLTVNEAAEYLRYAPSYMRKLVMLNKVPFIKFEKAVIENLAEKVKLLITSCLG